MLTTPVVRCLKEQLKDVEIHYLTKKSFKTIIENNPNVSKIYSFEKTVEEVTKHLKEEKYDLIVDLHHNLRSYLVKRFLKRKSVSFDKLNFQKWLLVNFRINRLPNVHIVDRYFKTVEKLGIKNDGKGLDYFIHANDEIDVSIFPRNYIAFVIGAKHNTKQLPIEKIISICKKINQPIVLLGGKEDFEKGEKIQSAINNQQSTIIYNTCGKYNLNQSASIVKQAGKVISHDTGLMHIAAAFKKEIISVWGNTIPEFGMYPYYGKSQVANLKSQVMNLSCRPCSKIGFDECPKGHFKCMNEINEEEIVDFVNA